jgi:glycosyltransferase involved in cell wall biosynthesis
MRILVVSADGGFVQGPICAEIALCLSDLGHQVTLVSRGHLMGAGRHALAAICRRPPDLVLGYNFSSILETGRGDLFTDLSRPNLCYHFDNPLEHYDPRASQPSFQARVRALPLVAHACWDRAHAERFRASGVPRVVHLPPGYLAHSYDRLAEEPLPPRVCDVGVMGNIANPRRFELLTRLAEEPLRLHVHVAHAAGYPLTTALRRALRPPIETDAERARFFRSCAVYLETPSNSGETGVNVRCLNAMACGAFVLAPHSPELREFFTEDELVTYGDYADLVQKLSHYLAHEEERARVRENGRIAVRARHPFRRRVSALLEWATGWFPARTPIETVCPPAN